MTGAESWRRARECEQKIRRDGMDECENFKPASSPPELSQWNIEDLEEYITRLKAEIDRAEQAISQKRSVGAEADALFRPSQI